MINPERLAAAFATARDDLLAECEPDGHWLGRLSSSTVATATALSALVLARQQDRTADAGIAPARAASDAPREGLSDAELDRLVLRGLSWLVRRQNEDGGWGDTDRGPSNLAATMLVRGAFQLTGLPAGVPDLLSRADAFIARHGGPRGLKRLPGRDNAFVLPVLANCALAGVVSWREVASLPLELAFLPPAVLRFLRISVAPDAMPVLLAVGHAQFHHRRAWNPLRRWFRRWATARGLAKLSAMQSAGGGCLGSVPLTSFIVMCLSGTAATGHPVIARGIRFLVDSVRDDGSWPVVANLATWVTVSSVSALLGGVPLSPLDPLGPLDPLSENSPHRADRETANERVKNERVELESDPAVEALAGGITDATDDLPLSRWQDWIITSQHRATHRGPRAAPGGWGRTNPGGDAPDAGSTAGALLALAAIAGARAPRAADAGSRAAGPSATRFDGTARPWRTAAAPRAGTGESDVYEDVLRAALYGVEWLLDAQNADGGWAEFRGQQKFHLDRGGADVTAQALRALGAWHPRFAAPNLFGPDDPTRARRILGAIARGFAYLALQQREDGSWRPLGFCSRQRPHEKNAICGTARVLLAFRDLGRLDAPAAQRGLDWLLAAQDRSGGWGATDSFGKRPTDAPAAAAAQRERVGNAASRELQRAGDESSSVEETALAVEALLGDPRLNADASRRQKVAQGLTWLVDAVEADRHHQPTPIGCFGSLGYYEALYPRIFAVSTLAFAGASLPSCDPRVRPRHYTLPAQTRPAADAAPVLAPASKLA